MNTTRRQFLGQGGAAGLAGVSRGRPNILFLMTDQMQGRVLDPAHPCRVPNLRRLAERGVRFRNAYTPNPVCSPARASLMTGLLPHSHGVTQVTHAVFPYEASLLTDKPHWAQRLAAAGYRTGYFGKWHVERTNELRRFGWQTAVVQGTEAFEREAARVHAGRPKASRPLVDGTVRGLPGYADFRLYSAGGPHPHRTVDVATDLARAFLNDAMKSGQPWCCFVSVLEPHDPYLASREHFARYDVDSIPAPPNWAARRDGLPGMYRKAARAFEAMSLRQKKEAAACYYAMISEIDEYFGRLIDMVDLENTIVVLTADHGELLGAHGLYMKNVSGFEEAYNIPLVIAGPGVQKGRTSAARVGLHDLAQTLLELAGLERIPTADSRSFASILRGGRDADFTTGYAENYGSRYWYTQRVVWDGPWKLVWNSFDFDELYNLEEDPYELRNLAADKAYEDRLRQMMRLAWRYVRETGDEVLLRSQYPVLRLAPFGPEI